MNSLSSNIPVSSGKVKGYFYPDNGYSTYLVSYFFDDGNVKAYPALTMPRECIPNSTMYVDLYPTYPDAFNAMLSVYSEVYREETALDAYITLPAPRRFIGAWDIDGDGNSRHIAARDRKLQGGNI